MDHRNHLNLFHTNLVRPIKFYLRNENNKSKVEEKKTIFLHSRVNFDVVRKLFRGESFDERE